MPEQLQLSRPVVWVVDDSKVDAERAERTLSETHTVQTFTDGSAVLEAFGASAPPDVLVLDWVMPGVSGIEVVEFLRSEKGRMPEVPVLLLTAQNQPEQIARGLSAGANDYLAKPYAPEELRARVSSLLRSARLLNRAVAAEKNVAQLLRSLPDALVVVDSSGHITFLNDEACRLFGQSADLLMGQELMALLPELSYRNITVGAGEGLLPLPDVKLGEKIYSPTVRLLPSDTAANTTIAFRDVTERRRNEERRLDFYSIIAHDLRSPLSAMLLRTEMLLRGQRGPLSPEVTADLRRFGGSIRSMVGMINDFLDLARLEGAGHKIDRSEVELASVISSTVEELRPLAQAARLKLEWAPPQSDTRVAGDRSRLNQVLSNLIGNAIKFTPPDGTLSIGTQIFEDVIETRVTDSGPGIAPEAVPTLFDRFTRVEGVQTVGTGLGLMIVREIVEAHGGKVGVHTSPGKGSTFWFRLPRFAGVSPGLARG